MFCPHCNSYADDSALVCSKCGLGLHSSKKEKGSSSDSSKKRHSRHHSSHSKRHSSSNSSSSKEHRSRSYKYSHRHSSSRKSKRLPDNLPLALLAILFFVPLGLMALFDAIKVKTLLKNGDIHGARLAAETAKHFSYVSIGIGIVGIMFFVAFSI